jgi:hypothetical protein
LCKRSGLNEKLLRGAKKTNNASLLKVTRGASDTVPLKSCGLEDFMKMAGMMLNM